MSPHALLILAAALFVGLPLAFLALLVPFFTALGVTQLFVAGAGRLSESAPGVRPGGAGAMLLALPKFAGIALKSIRRNLTRSALVYLALFVMVLVITLIWSVLSFLQAVTASKAANFKALVTEKYQLPSQMPPRYIDELTRAVTALPLETRVDPAKDVMVWSFVGTSLDPDPSKRSLDNIMFFFATDPRSMLYMFDDLEQDNLVPAEAEQMRQAVRAMQSNLKGIIISEPRLQKLNKKVGDKFRVYSFPQMYKDIEFEVEIVGTFPKSAVRYEGNAIMNIDYLFKSLDAYYKNTGKQHPMADRCVNLYWVRVPDEQAMHSLADALEKPGRFSSPPVKVERGSSAIASFLDAYKDIIAGVRFLLVPAIIAVMMLIMAIAISISVRERRQEMAVLKVLGFQPWQILALVLGEALVVGAFSGGLCTFLVYFGINAIGGVPFGIAFFPKFFIPVQALWWGPALGGLAAFAGSFFPAWSARSVRVSEVFAKVA